MQIGVAFAAIAFALYSCCDALIKSLGSSGLGVNEIAFFATLFSVVPGILSKPRRETWRGVVQLQHPWLLHLRAVFGIIGFMCGIYAFSTIPLAEAYSIIFLAPVFVVVLSIPLLGETVSARRWVFLAASFAGVLLVVRPGFRDLQLGHLAALAAAFCGAGTGLVMRRIAGREQRITIVLVTAFYIMLANGTLMLMHGLVTPSPEQWMRLAAIGAFMGIGHLLFITANKRAPASHVAPMQYSQIVWAILLGASFFGEFPDALAVAGLAVIVMSGLLNLLPAKRLVSRFGRDIQPVPLRVTESSRLDVPPAANDGSGVLPAPKAPASPETAGRRRA